MKLNEESSDFVYLGKRIDKALDYIQNDKTDLLDWFKQYVEIPYQDIMSGELDLEEEDYTFDYLDSLLDDFETKFNIILENQKQMAQEQLRMQMLAGVITEGEYKAKLEENNSTKDKKSLKENFVGMAAINSPFSPRKKESYEDAFEHFLSERYETKFENREQDLEEDKDPDVYEAEEIEEDSLGPNEISSLTPEGRFWIVSWRGMDGNKEKVFTDENEARAFMNTLEEGKEVEEPNNY